MRWLLQKKINDDANSKEEISNIYIINRKLVSKIDWVVYRNLNPVLKMKRSGSKTSQ